MTKKLASLILLWPLISFGGIKGLVDDATGQSVDPDGRYAAGDDARLSDARAPTAHASTHASAGADPITPASIGAEPAGVSAADITDSTTAGRAILTAVDASAQRTSLGLGTAALTASTDYALLAGRSGGQTLTGGAGVSDALRLVGTTANGTSTAVAFRVDGGNAGATTGLAVLNNGWVGINRADPVQPLDVKGSITARNSTTPTGISTHNTYTDASNYERGALGWNTTANTLTIGAQAAGTGTLRPVNLVGSQFNFSGNLFQNGTQIAFLPNQTDFTGTLVLGSGGGSLTHTTGTEGFYNTLVGIGAGSDLTVQANVTASGAYAAQYNTGSYVTASGAYAARNNTRSSVTASGHAAAQYNTGSSVTASGAYAAQYNTGSPVTANGAYAAQYNTGANVTASGYAAASNNKGANVTASGHAAARNNTGSSVTASGYAAAQYNTGSYVTASGPYAAQYNTGSSVTASGPYAAQYNTGANVTAIGTDAYNTWTNGATYSVTDADPTTEYVTVTAHGLGVAGTKPVLRVSASTISGIANGITCVFDVIDANTLKVLSGIDITTTGTATLTANTNQFINVTALGYDAEPEKNNQVMLGDTNVVEVKSFGKLVTASNAIRISTDRTPASSSDTCTAGELFSNASYLYKCTATNTIKRIAWSTF